MLSGYCGALGADSPGFKPSHFLPGNKFENEKLSPASHHAGEIFKLVPIPMCMWSDRIFIPAHAGDKFVFILLPT